MVSNTSIMAVSCPKCGAAPNSPCTDRHGVASNGSHFARSRRAAEERDFWDYIDDQIRTTDRTEQEILDSISLPGWTGRKARTGAPASRVLSMPLRDRKMDAAGDFDDAA
jgi:hypothetical protein